jgi:hypothetical protein
VKTEDGRYHHVFRQSWLNTADICLERARFELVGEMPRTEGDAAGVGTAVHHAIEVTVDALTHEGEPLLLNDAIDIAGWQFTELTKLPNFVWQSMSEGDARAFIANALSRFYDEVLPILNPAATEVKFGPTKFYEDPERVIELEGTIDYIDHDLGVVDWKTAGRPYRQWEKQRWAIQPTVYTWAAGEDEPHLPEPHFTYVVFVRGSGGVCRDVQKIEVTRSRGDYEFLAHRLVRLAQLIEADLPAWPVVDSHNLCSERWCGAWKMCKGQFL